MKVRWLVAVILVAARMQETASAGLEPAGEIVLAQRFTIHSDILDEDRSLLIQFPETYTADANKGRRYPVIYLLDGPAYFEATCGIVHHLSAPNAAVQRIPEHIVVAVVNTKRTRDMTPSHVTSGLYSQNSGGAASFRAFFEKELIPQVDFQFRTAKSRILVGHSLAGLFTLDTFVEQPSLFDAYIASDPSLWWDNKLLARKLAGPKRTQPDSRVKVFIAEANSPTASPDDLYAAHRGGIAGFRAALGKSTGPTHANYEYYEKEDHLSVPLVGIYAGLIAVYDDYKKP